MVAVVFALVAGTAWASHFRGGNIFIEVNGSIPSLSWNSLPGASYQVQSRDSLSTGNWSNVTSMVTTGGCVSWSDPRPLVVQRYYRLTGENLLEAPPELSPGNSGYIATHELGHSGLNYVDEYVESGFGSGVYAFSGEFHHSEIDLVIPGRGLDFIWARKYRSRIGPDTAQSSGWDFSYNIQIEACGPNVILHDGNSRQDLLRRQPDGTYSTDQLFEEGTFSNGVFILQFADKGTWQFFPLDGSAKQGKISRSTDRNGNFLLFAYDVSGRLVTITDTLNRNISVAYNGNGFIQSVTDFGGRQVRYEYDGEGNLAAAISPAVIGTPNGNDFPGGKTNRYTYSQGFADSRLNHNLLTITDAKGQTWLQNIYATTTDPANPDFDHVTSVICGNSNERSMFSYIPQTPAASNNFAVVKTIMNDRVGNVREYSYDAGNRLVMQRAFTGRAITNQITTETQNRPMNPLRTNDPPYFETRIEWNEDSLPTRVVHPNTNETQFVYESAVNPSASPRLRGNLRELHRLPGPLGGDQAEIVESFEYAPGFGTSRGMMARYEFQDIIVDGNPGMFASLRPNAGGAARQTLGLVTWPRIGQEVVVARVHLEDSIVSSYYRSGAAGGTIAAQLGVNIVDYIDEDDYISCVQYRETDFNFASRRGGFLCSPIYVEWDNIKDWSKSRPVVADLNNDETHWVGDCSITSFPSAVTDARGNVTTRSYDARGNCTNIVHRIPTSVDSFEYNSFGQLTAHVLPDNGSNHRRRDEFTYYNSGSQNGYLHQRITDADGFVLITAHEYDPYGNLTRAIDARGNDTLVTRNSLNQIMRVSSRQVATANGPVRVQRDYAYDANNNLVRFEVQNYDDLGVLQANAQLTTTSGYEILNRLTSRTQEVDAVHGVVTDFGYDANRNRALVRFGEAVSGGDANNVVQFVYDERGLLFQTVRAPNSADPSTNQFDYDANSNLSRKIGFGVGANHYFTIANDGFDRRTSCTDSMGNVSTYHYDPNGNVVSNRFDGELTDVPGGAGNVRLREASFTYDAMDRLTQSDASFFDTTTQLPIGDGSVKHRYFYTGHSRVLSFIDDNTNATFFAYDTANRLALLTDAKSNTVAHGYDANGNVTAKTEVDKSDLGNPDQTRLTTFAYDALDRPIQSVNNVNNTNRWSYDFRGNRLSSTDGRGNVTRYAYDGLRRLIEKRQPMTDTGTGAGTTTNTIVTTATWDDSSRLAAVTDGNTNLTRHGYDSLNRRIRTEHADTTTNYFTFDPHSNLIGSTDANSSVVTYAYDPLNRLTNKLVLRAAGVLGTTNETYKYDGLGRMVSAQDDDSLVTRGYDSLSHRTREAAQILPGGPLRTTTSAYDGVGNQTSWIYPGGRTFTRTFDSLNRLRVISDASAMIASNSYGGGRWFTLEQRDFGNGTRMSVTYDGIRRPMGQSLIRIADNFVFDTHLYQWDTANNKTTAQSPGSNPPDQHTYGFDSANRLVFNQSALNPLTTYDFDNAGNRRYVTGVDAGNYFMDPTLPVPGDSQVNQYTTTSFDSRQYDDSGNLKVSASGQRQYSFDYKNQLVQFFDGGAGVNAAYKYDCLGRRLEKSVNGIITRFYYFGSQCIEEQNQANATVATYVLAMDADTNNDGQPDQLLSMNRFGQNFFFYNDDLGSPLKVSINGANIVEQYRYGDYGLPSVFNQAGTPLGTSAIGNPYLFHGMRFDSETLCYQVSAWSMDVKIEGANAACLDPRAGRFISRTGTDGAGLNQFSYAGNNPVSPGIQASFFSDLLRRMKETVLPPVYGPALPPGWVMPGRPGPNPNSDFGFYEDPDGNVSDPIYGPWGPGQDWDWEKGDLRELKDTSTSGGGAGSQAEGAYIKG